jgi:hypothetical protein
MKWRKTEETANWLRDSSETVSPWEKLLQFLAENADASASEENEADKAIKMYSENRSRGEGIEEALIKLDNWEVKNISSAKDFMIGISTSE